MQHSSSSNMAGLGGSRLEHQGQPAVTLCQLLQERRAACSADIHRQPGQQRTDGVPMSFVLLPELVTGQKSRGRQVPVVWGRAALMHSGWQHSWGQRHTHTRTQLRAPSQQSDIKQASSPTTAPAPQDLQGLSMGHRQVGGSRHPGLDTGHNTVLSFCQEGAGAAGFRWWGGVGWGVVGEAVGGCARLHAPHGDLLVRGNWEAPSCLQTMHH